MFQGLNPDRLTSIYPLGNGGISMAKTFRCLYQAIGITGHLGPQVALLKAFGDFGGFHHLVHEALPETVGRIAASLTIDAGLPLSRYE